MQAYVGITDREWFEQLRRQPSLDEVNFWQPSAQHPFRALQQGELFLFKLHSPADYIVGGGIYSHWTRLRVSMAWDVFDHRNGANTLVEMRERIERYRRTRPAAFEDYEIGCILLQQPFFFTENHWLPVPEWKKNIVRGRGYDLTTEPGRSLFQAVRTALERHRATTMVEVPEVLKTGERRGKPTVVMPRLGQGSFKVLVADTYRRRCAVTGERALPVLQAAHIVPFAEGGEHRVDNGLLLRSDLHILFDRGYVTVTPDYRLEVSRRLRSDFDNGEEYLARRGTQIWVPESAESRPHPEFLAWHNAHRFIG